jgi:hypothetical protein
MADILGVKLNDEFQLPAPRPTPLEDLALNKLIFEIDRLPLSETLADWQRSTIASGPQYLRNQLHYGVWVQEQELDELVEILGSRAAHSRDQRRHRVAARQAKSPHGARSPDAADCGDACRA